MTTRNNVVLTAAVLASVLVLSLAVYSPLQLGLAADRMDDHNGDTSTASTEALPQPNDETVILEAEASNALFEPAAGLSNVFGPGGLFPFEDVFDCADALTCGVPVDGEFTGTFEEGNENDLTGYTATYTSPITYGPHQIAGHTYQIELTDTIWNTSGIPEPTRVAEFTQMVNNVGFDQIQHGASYVDRSDVPQLYDNAFLYGHVSVTDITDGNNTVVAEDVFTHLMVAHVMDENDFYQNLAGTALSPTMVFIFAINIPPDTELPGVGSLSPTEAQSFTPLPTDPSLENSPQVNYPVNIPQPRNGTIDEPESQSTVWPVGNPEQPLYFNFLVYQDAQFTLSSTDVEDVSDDAETEDTMTSATKDETETEDTMTSGTNNETSDGQDDANAMIELTESESGNAVIVDGEGFTPSAEVTIRIDGDTETPTVTQSNSNGEFVSVVAISGSSGDSFEISAEDDTGIQVEETFTVE